MDKYKKRRRRREEVRVSWGARSFSSMSVIMNPLSLEDIQSSPWCGKPRRENNYLCSAYAYQCWRSEMNILMVGLLREGGGCLGHKGHHIRDNPEQLS